MPPELLINGGTGCRLRHATRQERDDRHDRASLGQPSQYDVGPPGDQGIQHLGGIVFGDAAVAEHGNAPGRRSEIRETRSTLDQMCQRAGPGIAWTARIEINNKRRPGSCRQCNRSHYPQYAVTGTPCSERSHLSRPVEAVGKHPQHMGGTKPIQGVRAGQSLVLNVERGVVVESM